MDKETILNYVMNTPENTNRAVLSDMLDEFSNSGGNGNSVSALIVHVVEEENEAPRMDKTAGEIVDAMPLAFVYQEGVVDEDEDEAVLHTYEQLTYYVYSEDHGYIFDWNGHYFYAATIDDYPHYRDSGPV